MSSQKALVIVGGGASGLMAALSASIQCREMHANLPIIVLEKGPRVGKKLLATGNGRCNLSNLKASPERYHGKHPNFCRTALSIFSPSTTVGFFGKLGLLCRVEGENLVYPYCEQASAVLDCLRFACERMGVRIRCDAQVQAIQRRKNGFSVVLSNDTVDCQSVILAAGGMASPQLSSGDDGYRLAKSLGHNCTPLFPALVPVRTDPACTRPLKGIRVKGTASLMQGQTSLRTEKGEIQFSDGSLSGISVMQLSRLVSFHKHTRILLDLMPDYSEKQVQSLLKRMQHLLQAEPAERLLSGLLNKRVGQTLVKQTVSLSCPIGNISPAELENIGCRIKAWEFPVLGVGNWKNAQVTAGGLDTNEFDSQTMASRLIPGFYATGEVLDIDGDCGGFNLQWAWSSGHLAGRCAVLYLLGRTQA
ncbi:NAD(P)/FAD-dependent oxidoreductase [Solibaculum mannosilyticum]|uniref:Flavoprotein n=1 Tax=Solibaculum mannosilyticum TaxID=2780922 RepID=A0A7I8D6L8_9FIRM|nr:NAD(P)/FAD-dependent oxidoreductase [Solibaculum mannosilyticum]BCI60294.1 flavoprotein [Solibaculum mannosilyticum]